MNMQHTKQLGAIAAGLLMSVVLARAADDSLAPPVPNGTTAEDANLAGKLPDNLDPPSKDPRNFEGVWYPPVGGAGGGGPGGPPAGGGLPGGGAPGGPPGATGSGGPPGAPPGGGVEGPPGGGPGGGGVVAAGSQLECVPQSVAFGAGAGFTFGLVQSPNMLILMNEENQNYRIVYLNAEHPASFPPTRNGHSVGHWDGNTLVVDTIGMAGRDGKATGAHTIERVSKSADGEFLSIELSTVDPQTGKAGPGRVTKLQWRPDYTVSESVCEESYAEFTVKDGIVVLTRQVAGGAK